MKTTRRQLLLAAVAVPAGLAVARAAASLGSIAPLVRPPAEGSSASRCATCGASGHTMLDPRCPAAPRVLG